MRALAWATSNCLIILIAAVPILRFSKSQAAGKTNGYSELAIAQGVNRHQNGPGTSSKDRVAQSFGQTPLAFEPSAANSEAKFLARGVGYALFLAPTETVLALHGNTGTNGVLRMKLVGATSAPAFEALDELPGKSNYLTGKSPAAWRTNVPNFAKVAERNVYRGIDVVYYGNQHTLEYDFVVAPGSKPDAIHLAFEGADNLHVDQSDLVMTVAGGEVRMHRPVAYQNMDGTRKPVVASYAVNGGDVRFEIADYNPNRPLVIDPTLAYSTYLGGSNIDGANAIAVAPDNTAFVAGGTFSTNFPTAHPLQPNVGGPFDFPQDAFVAKLSADGSTLLYSTYLGGSASDNATGIAVDPAGDAYVTGWTRSIDFPVTNNVVNTFCGGDAKCGATWNPQGAIVSNGFLSKLNPAGTALIYSTYIGEYENVRPQAIAVDSNQLVYLAGETSDNITPTVPIVSPAVPPPPFPITGTAFQTSYGGGATDGFVMVVSATGTSVLYSSYYGGNAEDVVLGIAADLNQNAYLTGLTYSSTLPTSSTAFQATNGGAGDAFIAKVNTRGSGVGSLVYSSYFGGSGLDQGNGIAVDSNGNAYVVGGTESTGPGVPTSLRLYGGQGDAFLAKFNPSASNAASLNYFTYLGGLLADSASGVALDPLGNVYVTGSTVSPNFPITAGVFQNAYGGGNDDGFVTKFDPTGTTLLYSSYLGGSNTDNAYGIAVDTSGSAYVAGQTCSVDFPQENPEQAAPGGNCDAFISKVSILSGIVANPAGLLFPSLSLGSTSTPQVVTITNGDVNQTISSVTVGGNNPGDFTINPPTNCVKSLTPGQQCTISIVFAPTAIGSRVASISVNNTALGSPLVIGVSGTTSTLSLSPTNLSFGNQQVGTVSSSKSITATNNGTVPLVFSSILASGEFSASDDCTKAPLQSGTTCTISVTYAPTGVGSSIGALTLTDNAPGSPQVVFLGGTGVVQPADFTISATPPMQAVAAGQPASYALSLSAVAGFSQPVTLTCGGLPQGASCTYTTNPFTPGGSSTGVTMNIATALRTAVPPAGQNEPFRNIPGNGAPLLLLLTGLLILLTIAAGVRRRPAAALLGWTLALAMFAAACSSHGVAAGTPVGTYPVTVTGTSGAVTHTTTVMLQIQ